MLDISQPPVFRRPDDATSRRCHNTTLDIVNVSSWLRKRLASHPTLALAGSALRGVGVPGCIESGEKAAERIANALAASNCEVCHS
ncbi:MAG: FAD-dependent oxidoreductase [Pirellulaceae bacterium]